MLNLDKKVKADVVKVEGKQYPFKVLRPAAAYKVGEKLDELMGRLGSIKTEEDEVQYLNDVHVLLEDIIDAPKDIIEMFDFDHFFRMLDYLRNKTLYEQGFTEAEIKRMEKLKMKEIINKAFNEEE